MSEEVVQSMLDGMLSNPVMLFIKGRPDWPKCKYSRRLLRMLAEANVSSFDFFDVLGNDRVRQAIKERSGLSTLPQLFVNGQLVGGVDATAAAIADGSLLAKVPSEAVNEDIAVQLQVLLYINQGTPILFTSADPNVTEETKKAEKILEAIKVQYETVDLSAIPHSAAVQATLFQKAGLPQLPQLWVGQEVMAGFPALDQPDTETIDASHFAWLLEAVDDKYIKA